MFPTLFNVKINWLAFAGAGILTLLVIPDISVWAFAGLMIAVHQFLLLFYAYGYVIPVRYWAGALMCLQMLVGPAFAYSGLDEYMYFKYQMQVDEVTYFSYAIPAVILFVLGLHSSFALRGERVNEQAVQEFVGVNPDRPYIFIGVGFLASMLSPYFGSELGFVFYLIGSFKFIGLFMLLLGGTKLKLLPLVLVFGSIIISSLRAAMFHDLLTWLFFLLAVLAIKYRPTIVTKALITTGLVVMVIVIQQLKGIYRQTSVEDRGLASFEESYRVANDDGSIFSGASVAKSNVRINQGFIVTYAMSHVPEKEPFAHGGQLYKILEAAFLPRVIAPNKLRAGDNSFVTKYTGMPIRHGTSMSLSSLGDAYVNFGVFGGCIFMFVLGWVFNITLNWFHRLSFDFPLILIFTPLVFYYPIRPDTALQTGLGHLVKACFLLYMMVIFWKKDFGRGKVGTVAEASTEG